MSGRYEGNVRAIPPDLEAKLDRAVRWYEDRRQIPMGTGTALSLRWDDSDRQAVSLLEDIVEAVEDSWGIANEYWRKAPQ